MTVSDFAEVTKAEPGEEPRRADEEDGRPQQQGPHHDAPPGRRAQAPLPRHRLQADEGRRARRRSPRSSTTRTGRRDIALLHYADGAKAYILAPARLRVGSTVESGPTPTSSRGTRFRSQNIPTGTLVHNVELKPGQGGQIARSAGSGIQLVAKDEGYGVLRLPSGEMRRVPLTCRATVGQVGNVDHENITERQGRTQPVARKTPYGARLGDEPGRPPARRRRGQVEGRPSPGDALGRADARQAHPPQAQGIGPLIIRGRRRGKEKR